MSSLNIRFFFTGGTADVVPTFVVQLPKVSYAQRTTSGHVLECVVNAR